MPPSVDRSETNIGHGGPGLERQFKAIFNRPLCALALPALCVVLLLAMPAAAQDVAPTTAERIEQMRDMAVAAPDSTAADQAGVAEEQSTPAEQAEQEPLPPNELLPLGAGEGDLFAGQGDASASGTMGDGWLLSTLAALGVVIAIVFGIRWLLRRGGVVSTAAPQGGIVEVLSRTTVAPRSHVVLMRVGTRILVVSDSPNGMRTLASVHDPEEVAELLGAVDSAKSTSMSQRFGSVMKKLSGQWTSEEQSLEPDEFAANETTEADDQAGGALSSLRGRIAAMTQSGGRA